MRHSLRSLALLLAMSSLGCRTSIEEILVPSRLAIPSALVPSVASSQSLGNLQVQVLTSDDKLVTDAAGSVTIRLVSSDTAARLAGTTTQPVVAGVATFPDLSIARAGSDYRLTATYENLPAVTSILFSVTPGPAAKLAFDTPAQPVPTISMVQPFVARILDAAGNRVTTASNAVTLTVTRTGPFGFTVAPDDIFTPTTTSAVNGVVTFTGVTFHKSGLYTLAASSPGLTSASTSLSMMNGALTRLLFVTQPTNATAGTAIPAFTVQPVDDYGNATSLPPGPPYTVTIALASNPGGATLGGTLSVNQSPGIAAATFSNVIIDKPGTGYTLVASWTPLGGTTRTVTSAPFNVQ